MVKDLSTWLWMLAVCMTPPVGLFILGVYESRHEKHKRRQLWCVEDVDTAINEMHPAGGKVHKTPDVVFTKEDGLRFTPHRYIPLCELEESDGAYTITEGNTYKKICASANVLRVVKHPESLPNCYRFMDARIELVRVERYVITSDGCMPKTVDVLYWQFVDEHVRERFAQLSGIDDTIIELYKKRQEIINNRGTYHDKND